MTAAAISSSLGKRLAAFLEKRSLPSTLISKTPPLLLRRLTLASGDVLSMIVRANLARGS